MDLSNAYNWTWSHSWDHPGEEWEPESRSFEELGWTWKRPGQPDRLHGCDNRTAPKYNFMGCNVWRKENNPVQHCWRMGVLVRGEQPYALIVDDVRKDDVEHRYDWYMQIPDDVEFVPLDKGKVLLKEISEESAQNGRPHIGSRRLLVIPMGPGNAEVKMEEYASGSSRGKAHKARRLVISRQAVDGQFRVLLYPFRTTLDPVKSDRDTWEKYPLGAEVAAVSPPGETEFFVKLSGRKDGWSFQPESDGRSRVRLQRAGKTWTLN
jgi:hypothetical protein